MELSARNQIPGRVTAVKHGAVMAEVQVAVDAATVTAAITEGSQGRLDLKEGDQVTVIIKSTDVLLGK